MFHLPPVTVQVAVRVRPLNDRELGLQVDSCVEMMDQACHVTGALPGSLLRDSAMS